MSMIDVSQAERRIADRVDSDIAGQIAVSDQAGGVAFRDAGEMMEFAKMMAVSSAGVRKHLRGNSGACLAILTQALEWGLSPFAVANKSYFVNDQIAFESQLVQAVILKRAPIRGRIKFEYSGAGDARTCRAWARLRENDEVVDYTSPPLGKIPVKNSPLWKGDPDQQLAYYSGRALCRRHFPDVLLGILTDEEARDAPAIGPDRARDVTPPKGLGAKLDALAAKPEGEPGARRDAAAMEAIDHDPETGEAREPSPEEKRGDDDTPDDPHDTLVAEITTRLTDGERLTAVLNSLGDRRPLVTDADRKMLAEREKQIAAARRAVGVAP